GDFDVATGGEGVSLADAWGSLRMLLKSLKDGGRAIDTRVGEALEVAAGLLDDLEGLLQDDDGRAGEVVQKWAGVGAAGGVDGGGILGSGRRDVRRALALAVLCRWLGDDLVQRGAEELDGVHGTIGAHGVQVDLGDAVELVAEEVEADGEARSGGGKVG